MAGEKKGPGEQKKRSVEALHERERGKAVQGDGGGPKGAKQGGERLRKKTNIRKPESQIKAWGGGRTMPKKGGRP